jgi:LysR family hydrogen peroxide-inducible transcriptional activator
MAPMLPTLHKLYRRVRLLLRAAFTQDLIGSLVSGALYGALLALPVPLEDLTCELLVTEPLMVALPAGHPLAARATIQTRDLAVEQLLLLEEAHCLRDQALKLRGRQSARLAEEIRGTSLETPRQMVSLGVGCTVVPLLAVGTVPQVPSMLIQYRPFAAPSPAWTIGLAWRRRSPHDIALRAIAETLCTHAPCAIRVIDRVDAAQSSMRPNRDTAERKHRRRRAARAS